MELFGLQSYDCLRDLQGSNVTRINLSQPEDSGPSSVGHSDGQPEVRQPQGGPPAAAAAASSSSASSSSAPHHFRGHHPHYHHRGPKPGEHVEEWVSIDAAEFANVRLAPGV